MTDRGASSSGRLALLSRFGPWLLAAILFATSMVVARSFATPPGTSGPGPGPGHSDGPDATPDLGPPGNYAGPKLRGIFVNCSPACDLVVASEGMGLRLTFTDRAVDERGPSLSPDGQAVAFRCGIPSVEPGGEASPSPEGPGGICVVNTSPPEEEGATPLPVTTLLSTPTVDYGSPRWSPDGATIAFDFRSETGEAGIGLWDLLTGAATTISTPGTDASAPAWSPDGSTIAYRCGTQAMPAGNLAELFCTMARDGTGVVQLGGVDGHCGAPTYTPDAVHLGVVCVVPGADGGDLFFLALSEPMSHSLTGDQTIAPEGQKRVAFSADGAYVYVRRGDALWAFEPATEAWSMPPLPPLHGDFDLRMLE